MGIICQVKNEQTKLPPSTTIRKSWRPPRQGAQQRSGIVKVDEDVLSKSSPQKPLTVERRPERQINNRKQEFCVRDVLQIL